MNKNNIQGLIKTIGPGLLFASASIGTSHLILSTRAGAHHGMIFFWIILGILLLKYPFYEFGPRYASATGSSLLRGYKEQGTWAVMIFQLLMLISVFPITGAIGAVTAGLMATMFGTGNVPVLSGVVIGISVLILLFGGYKALDRIIKVISAVLLITVLTAFVAVIIKGRVEVAPDFEAPPLLEGMGLAVLVSLLGWLPASMEVSTMNSIWNVEKVKSSNYYPTLRESLFDFNLGFTFMTVLALMFMTIGAFAFYGTGEVLDGSATEFCNKLFAMFTYSLGDWAYYVIAIAAFGTIYGTLITVMDAYPRTFARGLWVLKFTDLNDEQSNQKQFLEKAYKLGVIITGIGGFCLFYFSATSMLKLLQFGTIVSFLIAPFVAYLNFKAIRSDKVPDSHRPPSWLILLSYIGLVSLTLFAVYYLISLF